MCNYVHLLPSTTLRARGHPNLSLPSAIANTIQPHHAHIDSKARRGLTQFWPPRLLKLSLSAASNAVDCSTSAQPRSPCSSMPTTSNQFMVIRVQSSQRARLHSRFDQSSSCKAVFLPCLLPVWPTSLCSSNHTVLFPIKDVYSTASNSRIFSIYLTCLSELESSF